ncbi:MAG: FAD-dependent oxidoreductase [Odoribacteraceae bacterium]|jgi:protoporphyrinogen oxidase|nr:FAD-dependent oxidoreductase [Odoribacteraceae bacterium]
MNNTLHDCIVTGGGISGVSFAYYLRAAGKKVIVIEKEHRAGGRLQTVVTGGSFRVEAGAHTCYNGYTSLLAIARELGLAGDIRGLERYPYLLDAGDRLTSVLSGISLVPLCLHGANLFFLSKEGKSVGEYYRRVVGGRNYDRLFSRAFRAVICQEADDYPAGMLLKRRATCAREFPRKYTFAGGMQSLVEGIAGRAGIPLVTGTTVVALRRDGTANAPYTVACADGSTFRARSVALAIDPPAAAGLSRAVEPALAALLAALPVARVESLALVVKRDDAPVRPFSGIIPLGDDYLSVVSADPLGQPGYRGFTVHCKQGTLSPGARLATALRVLKLPPAAIVRQATVSHLLPSPRVEHARLGEQLRDATRHAGIHLLGNYFHGLSIEDCVNRSREEAARCLAGMS